jgi:hypothetical protein
VRGTLVVALVTALAHAAPGYAADAGVKTPPPPRAPEPKR